MEQERVERMDFHDCLDCSFSTVSAHIAEQHASQTGHVIGVTYEED